MTATSDLRFNFLDVHILHAVPYSNLNRDNLGTPKQMIYGGAARARISSQCTKRAARLWLEANTELGEALRTRRLPQSLREELAGSHGFSDGDSCEAVAQLFNLAGIKVAETPAGELQGDQLTFTTAEAARSLAYRVAKHREAILDESFKPSKSVKDDLLEPFRAHNPTIALCGRMLAESAAGVNVDGALQVAHAFTTHASAVEQDYFTAVDDVVQSHDEETGAGHINVNEFTSGVFYRHATIGLRGLRELLDGSESTVAEVASGFLRAFTFSEPTGKQNAANAHTRPSLVAAALRSDRPVSFATAFESPVSASRGGGHMTPSIARLTSHAAAESAFYGDTGRTGAWCTAVASVTPDGTLDSLGENCASLDDLISAVEAGLAGSKS